MECLGHFDGTVPRLACILTKQQGVLRGGKYLLKTPGNSIFETLHFKMPPDALALKNLRLWCEFQSHLPFIISLILKNFLTALHYVLFNPLSLKIHIQLFSTLISIHFLKKIVKRICSKMKHFYSRDHFINSHASLIFYQGLKKKKLEFELVLWASSSNTCLPKATS